jgi:hypothetical protein
MLGSRTPPMTRVFALAVFLSVAWSSNAQTTPPPGYGFGSSKWSVYLHDVQQRGEMAKALYFSWAQGFITAATALLSEQGMVPNFTRKINIDQQQDILRALCQSAPNQDFSRAAMQLLDRLRTAEGLQPILRQ